MGATDKKTRLDPRGYFKITVTGTATALGALIGGTYPDETHARIVQTRLRPEGGSIRYRDDETNPTATDGWPVNDGEIENYDGPPDDLVLIRQGGADVTVHVALYS